MNSVKSAKFQFESVFKAIMYIRVELRVLAVVHSGSHLRVGM